jgi:hypothetical protein
MRHDFGKKIFKNEKDDPKSPMRVFTIKDFFKLRDFQAAVSLVLLALASQNNSKQPVCS